MDGSPFLSINFQEDDDYRDGFFLSKNALHFIVGKQA